MFALSALLASMMPLPSRGQSGGAYELAWSIAGGGGASSGGGFELRVLSTTAPVGLVAGGGFSLNLSAPPMAPGGVPGPEQILYSRRTPSNGTIWAFDSASGRETKITDGTRPRLSPDRRYLVFLRDGSPYSGRGNIYLRDLVQETERFFYQQTDFITGACFSKDGSQVVFDHSCGIYTKGLSAANAVQFLGNGSCYDDAPAIDPASGRLAFHNVAQAQIGLANPDGGAKTYIDASPVDEAWPVWSPDGRWIAAVAGEFFPTEKGPANLIKVKPDGSELTWLTAVNNANEGFRGGFAWTPDGQTLVAPGKVNGHNGVYLVAADGRGILEELSLPPGDVIDWIAAAGNVPWLTAEPQLSGDNLILTWPQGLTGYRLESATDLVRPQWQPYGAPGSNGVVVNVRSGGPARYFRLAKP